MARHVINEHEVTVEQYRGEAEHQWLFLRGKFKVMLKGLNVCLQPVHLYQQLEKVFARCGRYSDINLISDHNGKLTGVAVIDFITKGDARQAMK
ncbi:nucleotide-binding alpha-beta plait domain-containing protein, partial [Tanacetum coccineum]